jgi:hypothetical protein
MGREINAEAVVVEGETIPIAELMPVTEAIVETGNNPYRFYREMGKRAELDSYVIGSTRLLRRAAVAAVKADWDAARAQKDQTEEKAA